MARTNTRRTSVAGRPIVHTPRHVTHVDLICTHCHERFETPRQCLECGNADVCPECIRAESEADRAALFERYGIVI